MAAVTIYTKPYCPYCEGARELLTKKGVQFQEIDISGKPDLRAEMIRRANGGSTVPQIFVGERHLGGCDDIYALDARGGLDPILAG
ncbi:glutaredoxin 3 [Terrihabitans rhizophilus]|jgi:glutaredoxin 3|uniref:Glutaredoxin n=1 Tax=Terrihabitans rhizophilus TaxID=3092662 RepID=A0ABU4RNT9_9HYPH|nr:glutaredoxin 3 [Terrihabitans sp. PJ23]MDX6806517.1 glutaredoxin 3 [Terrihabitans sp. PJ23]